jgi:hypothetical protein
MWPGRVVGNRACVFGKGLLAGLAGTAAITGSQAIEMELTGRQPGTAPAEAAERVLGIKAIDDQDKTQLAHLVHRGQGASWGLFPGLLDPPAVRGATATPVHWLAIRGTGTAIRPGLEIAPPARMAEENVRCQGRGATCSTRKWPG